jgi:hypothetical protein
MSNIVDRESGNSGGNSSSNKEACDLMRTLLNSTGTYIARNIPSERNRLAYARAMSRCQRLCSEQEVGNDLTLVKQKLIFLKYDVDKRMKRRWWSRERQYYMMSVEHAIEVADSILSRFVNGYTNAEEFTTVADLLKGARNGHQICACLDCFGKV